MPKLKFETIIVPKKTQVLITNSRIPLASETIEQLSQYSHIEVLSTNQPDDTLPDISTLGVIVHFAGFQNTSLADTLSYTTMLHRLLQLASSYTSQFLLVLPNSRNHLYHSALTLITQYAKNFPLNYQVIEVDGKTDVSETAYEIIKKFIHKHHKIQTLKNSKPETIIEKKETKIIEKIKPEETIEEYKKDSLKKITLPKINIDSKINIKFFALAAGLLSSPFLAYVLSSLVVTMSLSCVSSSIVATNYSRVKTCSQLGTIPAQFMSSFDRLLPIFRPVTLKAGIPAEELVSVLNSTTQVSSQMISLQSNTEILVRGLISETAPVGSFEKIQTDLNLLTESLGDMQSQIRSWADVLTKPNSELLEIIENVNSSKVLVSKLQSVGEDWPILFATTQKQNYLLMLQDSTELRPSGGYLDSVLILSLDSGKIENIDLFTSQSIDNQLNGQVEPPPDFKALTGINQWYLRDSNWDPDFPVTAKRVSWFAGKELSRQIDGVIAINQQTIAELLKILGPVKIGSPEQTITDKNFQSTYLSKLDSNPQTLIFEVTEKITEKVKNLDSKQINQLTNLFIKQLESRQIMVYPTTFNSLGLESAGWSGGVGISGCRSQFSCLSTYAYITDTNIGLNKADAYINKTQTITHNVSTTNLDTNINLSYENTSSQSVWPAGDYKNYLRVYLPNTSKIESIQVGESLLDSSQYTFTPSNGLSLLGISLKIPVNTSLDIQIITSTPISVTEKTHFQFDLPNQPGRVLNSNLVNFEFPKSWFTTVYPGQPTVLPQVASPGLLRYNAPTSIPFSLDIDISPNN